MSRSLRLERPNAVYHIMNQGHYRQDLFVNKGTVSRYNAALLAKPKRQRKLRSELTTKITE